MEMRRRASAVLVAVGGLLSACTTMDEVRPVPVGTDGFTANEGGYEPRTLNLPEHTPAPPPVPVAVAAPPPPPAAPPDETPAVQSALRAWAAAWSGRDMAGYLLAYDPEFTGRFKTHAAWVKDRHEHIAARKSISVDLSDVDIMATGRRAQASFTQHYLSGKMDETLRKTLELRRDAAGQWVIVKETVAP